MLEGKIHAAVAVNTIFEKIIANIAYQGGEELTCSEAVKNLERYKSHIPAHLYALLYTMLVKYAYDFLDEEDADKKDFETIKNPYIYAELGEYRKRAEEKVYAEFGALFPENMVFQEIYAIVYEKYLKDVLAVW